MNFNDELPRILVVDDKQENRMLVTEYLESQDVIIDEAASGIECLKLAEQNNYSLIILDIQMPGMDGFEVLKRMRSKPETADIPVVLISAIFDSEEYIIKGIESGAIDYITKPVNITILSRKVANFLNLYEKQRKLDKLVKEFEIANDRLKENEKKFKRITQSANEAIIVLDSEYRIRFWNKASSNYFGYSKYEMIYEDFFERIISKGSHAPLKEYFYSLFEENSNSQINTIRISGRNKLEAEFPIELSLSYFTTAQNEVNYTVIIRDITRRARMEKEALKAKELHESNKLMKEFIDSVSHELRTPMNAVLGISNMLLKYNSDNLTPKQVEGLEIINQSGTRLLEMINDILDLSRIEAKKETIMHEEFSLDKLLASLYSMVLSLIENKDIKFHIRKSDNLPEQIISDPKKLNQVLTNILGNAVKFTHKGTIHLFIHKIENKIYFEISDTGIGIAEEHHSDIFERFKQIDNSQTKEYKGTGLGLNISKKLIELMGGEIKVESKLDAGTTMKFYIPFDNKDHQGIKKVKESKPGDANNKKVLQVKNFNAPLALVIDDDKKNQFLFSNILNSNGFEVLKFSDSIDGLRAIQMYIPDLIILKYEMPKIHGHQILNEISRDSSLKNIPIFILTSNEKTKSEVLSKNSVIFHESINEARIVKALSFIKREPRNIVECERLILYEKENHLKNFVFRNDSIYLNKSLEISGLILARKKIQTLILDGANLKGENLRLLKWLQQNRVFLPVSVVVVLRESPFAIITKELEKIPNSRILDLQEIILCNSLEKALENSVSGKAQKK